MDFGSNTVLSYFGSAKMCDSILLLKGTLLKCVGLCEEKDKEIMKNIVYLRIHLEGSSVVKDL